MSGVIVTILLAIFAYFTQIYNKVSVQGRKTPQSFIIIYIRNDSILNIYLHNINVEPDGFPSTQNGYTLSREFGNMLIPSKSDFEISVPLEGGMFGGVYKRKITIEYTSDFWGIYKPKTIKEYAFNLMDYTTRVVSTSTMNMEG